MQRSQSFGSLEEPDKEFEKDFRIQYQRQKKVQESSQASNMDNNRTLREFAAPSAQGLHSSIAGPPVEANNFQLQPELMSLIQQNQFGGSSVEDPHLHISVFLEYCDTVKLNGVPQDAVRLRLFPFSLRDKARAWLHSLPEGSITT